MRDFELLLPQPQSVQRPFPAAAQRGGRGCGSLGHAYGPVSYTHLDVYKRQEIYRESGQTYALGALPRILWVKNKLPELYARVKTVSMFNDWLIYKLTGCLLYTSRCV